jgi:hypothetical protein
LMAGALIFFQVLEFPSPGSGLRTTRRPGQTVCQTYYTLALRVSFLFVPATATAMSARWLAPAPGPLSPAPPRRQVSIDQWRQSVRCSATIKPPFS